MEDQKPLVSLLFPLYKSKQFLEIIEENINAVDYENIEFLFGDRHGLDDAIDLIESKYEEDDRFRFFRSNDSKGWLDNLNHLISQAKGKYFRFMPHDDRFPKCGLSSMVSEMERHNEIVLVFSPVLHYHVDDPEIKLYPNDENLDQFNQNIWNDEWILNFNSPMKAKGSFRGLINLEKLKSKGLFEVARCDIMPDRYFLFGLALIGKFKCIEQGKSIKMMYNDSVSAEWIKKYAKQPKQYTLDYYKMHSLYTDLLIKDRLRRIKFKSILLTITSIKFMRLMLPKLMPR